MATNIPEINGLRLMTEADLKLFARYVIEEYLTQQKEKPQDTQYLTPAKLAPLVGLADTTIRAAIQAGHYGQAGGEKRARCYATLTECRAWHFGGKQAAHKKTALAKSNSIFK